MSSEYYFFNVIAWTAIFLQRVPNLIFKLDLHVCVFTKLILYFNQLFSKCVAKLALLLETFVTGVPLIIPPFQLCARTPS